MLAVFPGDEIPKRFFCLLLRRDKSPAARINDPKKYTLKIKRLPRFFSAAVAVVSQNPERARIRGRPFVFGGVLVRLSRAARRLWPWSPFR